MVFVGRWSIDNVQIIYLWYDRFIPNPNSFDVVSHTNHCDIELDISMLLVQLDRPLRCKQSWHLTISTPCASRGFTKTDGKFHQLVRCVNDEKTEWCRFGVTWKNDVGSIPKTKMHLPVYIKYIGIRFVTKWGRGRLHVGPTWAQRALLCGWMRLQQLLQTGHFNTILIIDLFPDWNFQML